MIPENKHIYLVQPDLTNRCILNGVQVESVDFHAQVKGYSELSFVVDEYVLVNGQLIKSSGYDDLKPSMYLYLEDIGYFIMETPEIENDGNRETKSIVAYSAEKEFEYKDWRGIKINCGTTDSLEYSNTDDSNKDDTYFHYAIEYVSMLDTQHPELSFLHLILDKVSSKWNIQYVSPKLTAHTVESIENSPTFELRNDDTATTQMKLAEIRSIIYNNIRTHRAEAFRVIDGYDTGVFGNIDLNNRQKIIWTQQNLNKYPYAASQANAELGMVSTVCGSWQNYRNYGISVAFSPLLQIENESEPVLLEKANVFTYLDRLVEEARNLNEDVLSNILELDVKGFPDITDQFGHVIKQLIAGVSADITAGNSADIIASVMHYRETSEDDVALNDYIYPYILNCFSQENIGYTDYSKLPAIDVDNENLYAIMTSEVAPRMSCIFVFDYLNFGIRVYYKDELDFDTGIFVGFHNLENNLSVSVDTDSIFTRFTVEGDGGLEFRDYNYGDNTIINLDYFLNEPYMEESTVNKIESWLRMRDTYRTDYTNLALKYDSLLEKRDERQTREPSDASYWTTWDNMNVDQLDKYLKYFEDELTLLQQSVDDRDPSEWYDTDGNYIPITKNGEVDHELYKNRLYLRVNRYGGYYTYCEIIEYIIPYIKLAKKNAYVIDDEKLKPDTEINENWEMYGLYWLEGTPEGTKGFLEQYQQEMETLSKYSKSWTEMSLDEKKEAGLNNIIDITAPLADQIAQYEEIPERKKYVHLKEQVGDEDTPGTIVYQIKKLTEEIKEINQQLDELLEHTNEYATLMRYNVTEDELDALYILPSILIQERKQQLLNETELLAFETLIKDTDYQNSNIVYTSIMSISDKFYQEKYLYDDATDKLSEVSQPQYQFSVQLDNFFRLPDYAMWVEEFLPDAYDPVPIGLLKFIRVEVRRDYNVKLRVIGYRWNPCEVTPELTLEFSNFIVGRSGRSDLTELLELSNYRGSKNSIKIGNGGTQSEEEYVMALMDILKGNSLFQRTVANIAGGVTGGTNVEIVRSIIGDYLGNYTIQTGGTASLDDVTDEELAGRIADFEKGYFDQIVANYITTQDIHAESGSFKDLSAMIIQAQKGYFDSLTAKSVTADAVRTVLLEATKAEIETLVSDDIIANTLNTFASNAVTSTVNTQFVKDLIAGQISVGDLAAGDIIISENLRIISDNGRMIMDGTALQIMGKTASGEEYTGIQLGYDTNNNPSLIIRNENNAVILDPNGITENAIADQLIRNSMIKDGTLGKEKLGFTIIEPNDQGGIDITQLYDGEGNLWGQQYASFKNEVTQFIEDMAYVGASVELHGQQVFVEREGTISPDNITLKAEVKHATIDKWFIDDVEDTIHLNASKDQITIPSSLIDGKKTLTVRVQCAENNVYDIMTLYRVSDGESTYTIILSSSKGELFKEDDTTSVTCTVYYGSNIVTAKKYYWTITVTNGDEEIIHTEETTTNVLENIPINSQNLIVNVQCDVEI